MKNMIVCIVINVVYLVIWLLTNKIRNSKNKIIRDFDCGNEFYEFLDEQRKEEYWKEDTKILNIFFIVFLFFLEISVLFIYQKSNLWILSLMIGLIIATVIAIILNIRLKKKFKN